MCQTRPDTSPVRNTATALVASVCLTDRWVGGGLGQNYEVPVRISERTLAPRVEIDLRSSFDPDLALDRGMQIIDSRDIEPQSARRIRRGRGVGTSAELQAQAVTIEWQIAANLLAHNVSTLKPSISV